MTARCPNCGVSNNWVVCPECGGTTCNSCGCSVDGSKRRAANVCPYCGKTVHMQNTQRAPAWARTYKC